MLRKERDRQGLSEPPVCQGKEQGRECHHSSSLWHQQNGDKEAETQVADRNLLKVTLLINVGAEVS